MNIEFAQGGRLPSSLEDKTLVLVSPNSVLPVSCKRHEIPLVPPITLVTFTQPAITFGNVPQLAVSHSQELVLSAGLDEKESAPAAEQPFACVCIGRLAHQLFTASTIWAA